MNPSRHGPPGRKPAIGITPDLCQAPGQASAVYELKVSYVEAVSKAGGLPVVLPYSDEAVDGYLERINGLLVTGGAFDIPPEAYGDAAREGLGALKPSRTAFEAALMEGALRRNMPVLGICGGMQLLNVVRRGTLFQDISRELENAKEHEQKHDRTQPQHPIEIAEHTLLAELLGSGQLMVNSTHHQAVKQVGEGVVVSAVAPDGVVEAIELPEYPFAIGVQWHPELMVKTIPQHMALYRAFVQRAREQRG